MVKAGALLWLPSAEPLRQHVPRNETFDVLDGRRLTAFFYREEQVLHLKNLTGKVFTSIEGWQ